MLGAIFAAFVGLAAAQCTVQPNTNCSVPSYSTCVETCSLYQSEKACSHAGCSWVLIGRTESCSIADSNITEACTASTTSMSCDALPNCTWATTYCKQEHSCTSTNSSLMCTPNLDEAACLAEGAHCQPFEHCSETADVCGLQDSQVDCTTISGCFWYELSTTVGGAMQNISKCQSCFKAPDTTENYFSSFQAVAGLTCAIPGQSVTISFSVVAASSMGCSGGSPVPMDFDVVCPPSSAPTNAPPANGTDAPTPSDTNSTDAPTPFDTNVTSSAVAVPVTVAALGACALLA